MADRTYSYSVHRTVPYYPVDEERRRRRQRSRSDSRSPSPNPYATRPRRGRNPSDPDMRVRERSRNETGEVLGTAAIAVGLVAAIGGIAKVLKQKVDERSRAGNKEDAKSGGDEEEARTERRRQRRERRRREADEDDESNVSQTSEQRERRTQYEEMQSRLQQRRLVDGDGTVSEDGRRGSLRMLEYHPQQYIPPGQQQQAQYRNVYESPQSVHAAPVVPRGEQAWGRYA